MTEQNISAEKAQDENKTENIETEIKDAAPASVIETVPEPFKLPAGNPIPLEDEIKLLKNFEKLFFDEEPDQELKKDMPEQFFIMDLPLVAGFAPKTQEARRILARFYNRKIKLPTENNKPGPGNYSIEMMSKALKVFDYHKAGRGENAPAITITSNKDAPIKIEDQHFIFYLAPRIESV